MTPGEVIAIVVSALVTVITGVVLFVLKGYIADLKKYRSEREIKEQAKDELVLGMARVMLLENYRKCEEKGFFLSYASSYNKEFESHRRGIISHQILSCYNIKGPGLKTLAPLVP